MTGSNLVERERSSGYDAVSSVQWSLALDLTVGRISLRYCNGKNNGTHDQEQTRCFPKELGDPGSSRIDAQMSQPTQYAIRTSLSVSLRRPTVKMSLVSHDLYSSSASPHIATLGFRFIRLRVDRCSAWRRLVEMVRFGEKGM